MKVEGFKESVGNEAIDLFQRVLKKKLPRDYYNFLMKFNGGYPVPNCFCSIDKREESSVQNFYKINSKESYDDLLDNLRVFRNRIPEEFLAIGSDPGGNQICIAINGTEYGKVYFWDHEFEVDDDEIPTMKNMSLIANSFDEFLNTLYED